MPQAATYTKIDDDKFYAITTNSTQLSVSVTLNKINSLQTMIDTLKSQLTEAAKAGVQAAIDAGY